MVIVGIIGRRNRMGTLVGWLIGAAIIYTLVVIVGFTLDSIGRKF
jgi:hypothetical protein